VPTGRRGADQAAPGRPRVRPASVPEVTVDGVVVVLEPSRRRRCVRRPLPSVAGSSPKDTQLSEQICASEQTRVGAELPRPQTQSRLKAHSKSPASGPASVASRRAPRGSSSRRQRGGPTGQERSYAGAAQYPCAEHRGGRPRAAPSLPRRRPGLLPGYTCCAPRGHKQLPWVMGCPPHQERRRTVTSPPGPGPSSSTPHVLTRDGGDSHNKSAAAAQSTPGRRVRPERHVPSRPREERT
jgi:hypothetical protein